MPITFEHVFSKSPERAVTVEKIPTTLNFGEEFSIQDATTYENIAGTRQYVGKKFRIISVLREDRKETGYVGIPGKTIRIMRKINTGAYSEIGRVTTGSAGGFTYEGTFTDPGTNTFQAIFDGDATYAGCAKSAKTFVR